MYIKIKKRLNKEKLITKIVFIIEKILSRCPYFFRLDNILGDRPNVRPPVFFDSGSEVRATAEAIDTLLGAVCPSNENEQSVSAIREMEADSQRGPRAVSVQIQGSENLGGRWKGGNEPCGVIERGGKERYSGRRDGSESGENVGREEEGRRLEEEPLVQEELGDAEGGRREEIGEGSRNEIEGGGDATPVGLRGAREVSGIGRGRRIGMKPKGKERSIQKQEISTK